ncbi:MAG: NAD+ synthase [Phycisphaerae bacterium]
MRVALAQLNPTVGDLPGNAQRIAAAIARAKSDRADLLVLPELALCGYPPRDLVLRPGFVAACRAALERIAADCRGLTALVGFPEPTGRPVGRPLYNAVAVCRDGRIADTVRKSLLPTYDVFDEDRYFEPAERCGPIDLPTATGRSVRVGVSICEDIWNGAPTRNARRYRTDPIDALVAAGAELLVNVSASPFEADKEATRVALFSQIADRTRRPIVYVNQVGGNDDIIFDGASALFVPGAGIAARAAAFAEDWLVLDLPPAAHAAPPVAPYPARLESIYAALVLGTRDYVRKCGFRGVVLGLSGGIDSALTAAIAADAVGAENVHAVALPSRFSSPISLEDARAVAHPLRIDLRVLPIESLHAAFEQSLAATFAGRPADITEENLQARARGALLMALSNKFGWLLLTTGNKSELAVGYCTLYGDMCGGLAVIADVPKTVVYDLARWLNQRAGRDLIPARTLDRPPTAELRPDQTDQDTLPPYATLDAILQRHVEELQSADEIIAAGFDPAVVRDVLRKVATSEYKRRQAAVGLKISGRAFGTGWRMPIAARSGQA